MRLILLKEVMNICGLGRSSNYKLMEDGRLPKSVSFVA
ncbi:AlpA family phage regulatory protein [Photobacterium damselae]|nr:AlpA family phage regulatory protein [Photobacterium damselae]EHA1081418.1 AlpA family phage regulatory protein [Photobacterium damselae]MBA5682377.1 AlpA family phage regulatory protein [Photobacterium damselae subsp. damselae]MCG3824457.1 AlpA family phage regulatory protein [Photobacterium damselae]NVH52345.1 AlpA family phage regulatory protein [Photobacterium damselae subsp. damselae]NVO82853.1 AlpA family phage regulatory protein [Photobacterium damselae subsp. damselae]